MRKFLMLVAVGALALLVAAPAMALDVKWGAEYRVRFYDYQNAGFDNKNVLMRGNPRNVQIRVRPMFSASDDNGNITATWRAEFGDTDFGAGGGANGTAFGTNGGSVSIAPSGARVGNGAGGSIGADGVALETKWAFMDFAMPFNVPLRVRAGIQPWYLPKGLIIDDDIAGVRAYGKMDPVSYEAFWYRASRSVATSVPPSGVACLFGASTIITTTAAGCTLLGGTVTGTATISGAGAPGFDRTRDSALDYYGTKIDIAIAPWLNPGAYFVYGDNRLQCSEPTVAGAAVTCANRTRPQYFIGVTATGTVGIVGYDIDWVYGSTKGGITGTFGTGGITTTGAIGSPINVGGWMLDLGVHVPIGPVKWNILASYATGDKQNGGGSEAFPLGPGPSWAGAGGQYELIGEGGAFDVITMTQANGTNLWMLGTTFEYVPVKPLWIKLAYGYAGFSEKNGNCGVGIVVGSVGCFGPTYVGRPGTPLAGKSGLGQEVHLRADYTMWTGFKVQAMSGWLFPRVGNVAGKYILQLLYNF